MTATMPDLPEVPDDIRNWVDELILRIRMGAFGEPKIVRFGEGDLLGDTHVQLITTSHIVVHTVRTHKVDAQAFWGFDVNGVNAVVFP